MNDDTRLKDVLSARIAAGGPISFAEFMEACLYEPGLGYYTSPGRKVGAEGDFYTSISVHASFGRVMAREMTQMWRCMGEPPAFTLVECGAGNGRLACDILDYLREREALCYGGVRLVLVEREPSLASAQAEMLAGHAGKVAWLAPQEFYGGAFRFSGCLYSNELIDALPVHRVVMTDEGLAEVFVTMRAGELAEETAAPSTPELRAYLTRLGITLAAGQQAEINLNAPRWLEAAASGLERGFVLTVDYGFPAAELYAPHRGKGTLLCYHRHRTGEDPYIRLGQQDMTAHVDFTTLMASGERLGLETVWFGEQYRFLLSAGIVEELEEMERSGAGDQEKLRLRLLMKKLIMPEGGMGDTFRLLIQSRGVATPRLLCQRGIGRPS